MRFSILLSVVLGLTVSAAYADEGAPGRVIHNQPQQDQGQIPQDGDDSGYIPQEQQPYPAPYPPPAQVTVQQQVIVGTCMVVIVEPGVAQIAGTGLDGAPFQFQTPTGPNNAQLISTVNAMKTQNGNCANLPLLPVPPVCTAACAGPIVNPLPAYPVAPVQLPYPGPRPVYGRPGMPTWGGARPGWGHWGPRPAPYFRR